MDKLRLQFGTTATEAEAQLSSLRRDPAKPLAEYSAQVQRLVGTAYPDVGPAVQDRMTMERFKVGLNHPGLQGHLLARRPLTIDDMVRDSKEYLRVTACGPPRIREVDYPAVMAVSCREPLGGN